MLKKTKRIHPIIFRLGLEVYWRNQVQPYFFSSEWRWNIVIKNAVLGWGNYFQILIYNYYIQHVGEKLIINILYSLGYLSRFYLLLRKNYNYQKKLIRRGVTTMLINFSLAKYFIYRKISVKRKNIGLKNKGIYSTVLNRLTKKLILEEQLGGIWLHGFIVVNLKDLMFNTTNKSLSLVIPQIQGIYNELPKKTKKYRFILDLILSGVYSIFLFNTEVFLLIIAREIAKTRKQSQFLSIVSNILSKLYFYNKLGYSGARLLVKGKIGRHGRTKTFYSNIGIIQQQNLKLPINFYFITTATYYGALGIRLWLFARKNKAV